MSDALDAPSQPDIQVAIAILSQGDRVLLQLRDNIPNIIYPGHWGFFGGHIEVNETPYQALARELYEEIGYDIPHAERFGIYGDRRATGEQIIRHVFHVPLTVPLSALHLNEGWDMALVPRRAVENGGEYSAIAQQWRPMPKIHQQILLDFFRVIKKI